ncbi:hypothetical protein BDZ91DRAFT_851704 [Kalaharituber pfeilii]|nr:hypothetical protein BDZ91DRAFT_851704 [Kalaharituber pfeilii]
MMPMPERRRLALDIRQRFIRGSGDAVIIVAHPSEARRGSAAESGKCAGNDTNKQSECFVVDRKLLASLSKALHQQLYDEIGNALDGFISVRDVDGVIMERFLSWAYDGDYDLAELTTAEALLAHIRVYRLADEFQTRRLKEYAWEEAEALLRSLKDLRAVAAQDRENLCNHITQCARTCFTELIWDLTELKSLVNVARTAQQVPSPTAAQRVTKKDNLNEVCCVYLAQFMAYNLSHFRELSAFAELVQSCWAFAQILLHLLGPACSPPWSSGILNHF